MPLNRGEIITEALYIAGNRTDLGTPVKKWFNWALHRIDRVCDVKGLEVRSEAVTVDGQKAYALPSDCKYLETLRLIDGANSRPLISVHHREFDQKIPYPEQSSKGRSKWYVEWETIFELYPIPDDEYTLLARYWKWQDDITADATMPEISYCDDIIVQALVAEIWKNLEELDNEASAQLKLVYMLNLHKGVEKMHPDFEPKAQPFSTGEGAIMTERWKNPFDLGG